MKRIIAVIVSLVVLVVPALAFGNTYPANAPLAGGAYMEVQTTQVGRAIIYVPIANKDFFFTVNRGTNTPVNITSATITCEIYSGANFTTHTQVRFTRFNTAEYYVQQGQNMVWTALNITAIHNTNLLIANQNEEPVHLRSKPDVLQIILIALLGVIVICLFFSKSRS